MKIRRPESEWFKFNDEVKVKIRSISPFEFFDFKVKTHEELVRSIGEKVSPGFEQVIFFWKILIYCVEAFEGVEIEGGRSKEEILAIILIHHVELRDFIFEKIYWPSEKTKFN
jgi:hypothetical protein